MNKMPPPDATDTTADVPSIVRSVPRHRFVAPELHRQSYRSDTPSRRQWQGIPPDRVVVRMVEALEIDGGSRVLEFGTGLGFTAAVLGKIADEVVTVGRGADRRQSARERLQSMGLDNVEVLAASSYKDQLPDKRFDAILVSAVNANPPKSLVERLAPNGKLVVLLETDDEHLTLNQVTRGADGSIQKRSLGEVRFSFLIGDILVDLNAALRSQVEKAAEIAGDEGHPIGQVLLEQGLITEEDLYEALALQHGLEYGDPDALADRADSDLVDSASATSLQHQQLIPIRRDGDLLEIASVDPDPPSGQLLRQFDAKRLEIHLIGPSNFRRLWEHLTLGELPYWASTDPEISGAPPRSSDDVYNARLRSLFHTILRDAVAERATDIHLEAYEDDIRVRFRVDGVLRDIDFYSLTPAKFERLRRVIKVQAELPITEREGPQSGRFQRDIDSTTYDFRVQLQPTLHDENVVIRILPHQSDLRSIAELGFPQKLAHRYRRHLDSPSGLLLVVGPTSSGKTTTVYAGLRHFVEDPTRKVITVEDPIEYAIDGIEQTEVAPDLDYSFGNAVRTLVRRDPDVLVVGEIRDEQTALQAIRASQTGHLVLSTLHANDTADAVQRLVDLGLDPSSIASELTGIFAQRLARRVCDSCREQVDPDPEMLDEVFPDGPPDDFLAYDGHGCVRCRGRGVRDRVAMIEYLRVGPEMRRAIGRDLLLDDLRLNARETGMTTLKEAGIRLVRDGIIPLSELPRLIGEDFLLYD